MVKKQIFLIISLMILLFGIVPIISIGSTPNVNGHSADNILITMKGYKMTLQYAITKNYFKYGVNPISDQPDLPNILNGHSADEIKIIINSNEMTLQDALNSLATNKYIFCSGGSSTPSINIGHDSNEIKISYKEYDKTKINGAVSVIMYQAYSSCNTQIGHDIRTDISKCNSADYPCLVAAIVQCPGFESEKDYFSISEKTLQSAINDNNLCGCQTYNHCKNSDGTAKQCGDNGCGESCGTCDASAGKACNSKSQCQNIGLIWKRITTAVGGRGRGGCPGLPAGYTACPGYNRGGPQGYGCDGNYNIYNINSIENTGCSALGMQCIDCWTMAADDCGNYRYYFMDYANDYQCSLNTAALN